MLLFLTIFLTVYSLMHLLVYYGIRPILPAAKPLRAVMLGWALLMIVSPILVRVLERFDQITLARLLAWVAYIWMGFLWLAFAAFLAQAFWNGMTRLLTRFHPKTRNALLTGARPTLLILLLVWGAGTYAFFEARDLRVEHISINSPALSGEHAKLRIVQISDLHLGLLYGETELRELVRRIQTLKPDLVAATGDILDIQRSHLNGLAQIWQGLQPPLGKFAVIGNHEIYTGKAGSIAFLEKAGFKVLQNELIEIGGIEIAGINDPARNTETNELKTLSKATPGKFTLFLKHRPWIDPQSKEQFNLQLSGHAHRGQIFPFNLLTGIPYPLQDGLYPLAEDRYLYTSRGTGCWGPPMRLFSPPELTVINLVATKP